MTLRTVLSDFALDNPFYAAATVSVWQVDATLAKTATLATLYAGPAGLTTLTNPQVLDSRGKMTQPVYVDRPVIMTVDQGGEETDTGVVGMVTRWRGRWVTGTIYYAGERLQHPVNVASYIVLATHVAGVFATDVSNDRLELESNGVGDAVSRADYATAGQVQDGAFVTAAGISGGLANAQTITVSPAITAYAYGQRFSFVPGFNVTGPATLAVSELAAKPITHADGVTALAAFDVTAGELVEVWYDGTGFRLVAPDARLAAVTDQIGWRQVSSTGWDTPMTGLIFSLPAGNRRFRLELQDVLPSTAAQLYLRFSVDGGVTYIQGTADYGAAILEVTPSTATPTGGSGSYLPVTPVTALAAFGDVEWTQGPGGKVGSWRTQAYAAGPTLTYSSGVFFCGVAGLATHVLIGFAGGVLSGGTVRLLATTF